MRIDKPLLALCLLSLPFRLEAQTVPIACAQYIDALEACLHNAVNYYSRIDIDTANEIKSRLKRVDDTRTNLKQAVLREGADTIGRRCTSPEFTTSTMKNLTTITSILVKNDVLDGNCTKKMHEIRTPN